RSKVTVAMPSATLRRKCSRFIGDSFRLNVRALDQVGHSRGILVEVRDKILRTEEERFNAYFCELGFDIGSGQRFLKRIGKLVDDWLRRTRGRGNAKPRDRVEALEAEFIEGRNVRQLFGALKRRDSKCTQCACLDVFEQRRGVEDAKIDLTGNQVNRRW